MHGFPGNLVPAMVLGWSPYGQAVPFLIVSSWSWDGLPGNLAPAMVLGWSHYGQTVPFLIDSRQACAHNSASMVSLWADFP